MHQTTCNTEEIEKTKKKSKVNVEYRLVIFGCFLLFGHFWSGCCLFDTFRFSMLNCLCLKKFATYQSFLFFRLSLYRTKFVPCCFIWFVPCGKKNPNVVFCFKPYVQLTTLSLIGYARINFTYIVSQFLLLYLVFLEKKQIWNTSTCNMCKMTGNFVIIDKITGFCNY